MRVKLPWRFPREADRIRAEVDRLQQLSSDERFDRVFDLIASGATLVAASDRREAVQRLRERDKLEWRGRFRELFERYEAKHQRTS